MNLSLHQHLIIFLAAIVAPLFLYIPLGLMGSLGGLAATNALLISLALASISAYYYLSWQILSKKLPHTQLLSILFYANFLIYMLLVLVAFNLIVVSSFLYGGDVPMGMDLEVEEAPTLMILGIYILIVSSFGMHYLAWARKQIQKKAT